MSKEQILVVEDSRMFANVIRGEIQSRLGFQCRIAVTFEETRRIIEESVSDFFLAILDLNLPDARDEEIVDYVLSKGLPSIVFTGNFSDDVRERVLSKDVVDYVLKESTQDVDYLVRAVRRIHRNQSIKILVVDDSSVTRMLLKTLLSIQKFIVLEADSGEKGLEVLKQHPDIKMVITDYNMPKMDGFEFVSNIRKKYTSDKLAIIGISAHGSGILSAKFLKKGANDFVNKPFAKEEFYCRVNQNLEMLEYISVIQDASNKDYLTNLYNRRYFFDLGRKIFENAKRGNMNITIGMIDIDHFKKINDTYGHDAGDAALKAVGETICDSIRRSDLLARFGGEEFCLLVTNLKKEKTFDFFDDLRKKLESNVFKVGDKEISLTVSIGVKSNISDSLEETINMADELLYKAKQAGRNTVIQD
jgi:diguanylate cyclase (GGDEF)-like protein